MKAWNGGYIDNFARGFTSEQASTFRTPHHHLRAPTPEVTFHVERINLGVSRVTKCRTVNKWGVRKIETIFNYAIPTGVPIKMARHQTHGRIIYPVEDR
ncbi:hypothetical protein PS880_01440 [Pseudomonas fluorescens]|uniref:Uncharacterized protein n=1 Tax=Pseudomonas fluorescens TaxID=294 RepID=A0A5E7IAG5_PSEFL|nr:hypothetical protein PS880_01440 [Pseudomonas fluorescens]